MIKMSDLIKQQGDVIRTQTGIKKVEEATFGGKTLKIPQPKAFGGDMEKYLGALTQHMKDLEKSIEKYPADDPKYTGDDPFDIEDPLTVGDDKATQYKKVQQGRKEALNTIKSGELNADSMQDTFDKIKAYADWMGYEEIEEFEEELEDMIEDQDTEWFIDRAEELLDPDKKEKEMGDYLAQMDYEDEDSPESYYDDGNTKQTKVMKQNDATAKKINPNLSNSKD